MLSSSISSSSGLQIFSMAFVRSGGDSIRHFSMFALEFLTNEYGLLKRFVCFRLVTKICCGFYPLESILIKIHPCECEDFVCCIKWMSSNVPIENKLISVFERIIKVLAELDVVNGDITIVFNHFRKFCMIEIGKPSQFYLEFILALGSRTTCNNRKSSPTARLVRTGRRLDNFPPGIR